MFIGKTKIAIYIYELKLGLFTARNVSKGTVLCINTGCKLDKSFWDYSDYDLSYIRLALDQTGWKYLLVERDEKIPIFADFTQDPLDPNLVNAQLEVDPENGLIGVKRIKDLSAGDEVLIPSGKASWALYFRYNCKNIKDIVHNLLMIKAKEVYFIDDVLANTVSNNYHICKTIATKLDEFENWQNGLQYHCTHFIQTRGNSYINAYPIFQH